MITMHNKIIAHLSQSVSQAFKVISETQVDLEEIYSAFTTPPDCSLAHAAFPLFRFSKACKISPPELSKKIAANLKSDDVIALVMVEGPYINFKIYPQAYATFLIKDILNDSYFARKLLPASERTMIEYSQPNTHKELHVGHMRNLCLGSALVEIKKYCGEEVLTCTYPGDMGTHVAKCLWYLQHRYTGPWPEDEKGTWLGQMYATANLTLEDELGSEKEEENRRQLTGILKELESGRGEYFDLWKKTRQWSIDLMHKAYHWAGVEFDRWFFESELDGPSLKFANELYAQGVLVKDQGAIGMDLSADKLGFCLLIKSDGTGLYSTKDVALAKKKFEEFKIKKNIYIVDTRQAYHFKQVFKVLEKIGFSEARDCFHLEYNFVELPGGAMSSRKGNIVPLMDLIDNMEATLIERYLNRYQDQWTPEEIQRAASEIANGAIKYGMTRVDTKRKIVFDMDEWLKLEGETGPYLQYVYARIQALLRKVDISQDLDFQFEGLQKNEESTLLVHLGLFNETVLICHQKNQTMGLCSYLYDLGKLFNSFYSSCPVLKAETAELAQARAQLSLAVGKVMKIGLSLLGIPAPERM